MQERNTFRITVATVLLIGCLIAAGYHILFGGFSLTDGLLTVIVAGVLFIWLDMPT